VCRRKNIRSDDFVEKTLEFTVSEPDAVEHFEFLAEVLFQRGAVANIGPIFVLETAKLLDEAPMALAPLFPPCSESFIGKSKVEKKYRG